jgi:hypothetical protein
VLRPNQRGRREKKARRIGFDIDDRAKDIDRRPVRSQAQRWSAINSA